MCGTDGKIHLVGGRHDGVSTSVDDHYVYDRTADTWTTAAPLPAGTAEAAVGSWAGKIYVLGGYQRYEWESTPYVHVYDVATDTWTTGTPMEDGHTQHRLRPGRLLPLPGRRHNGQLATRTAGDLALRHGDRRLDPGPGPTRRARGRRPGRRDHDAVRGRR